LFFNVDGGDYASYGSFTESPIDFTAAGDGEYGFYTVAVDAVGNVEAIPDSPPDASTIVDTSASSVPTLVAEPEFTIGTTNTVAWSDESGSGAVAYYAECATDAEFTAVVAVSDWIAGLTFEFTELTDGQIYYYRVMSRDDSDNESDWSASVFSTQDATPPVSSVDELPPVHGVLTFDVAYTAADAVSGMDSVELFFNVDGGDYTSYGSFTESPIDFTAAGDGEYGFYTVAVDAVGNVEAIPDSPPDASTIVETGGPVGTFAIAGGAASTSILDVDLNSAVTGAVDMRFSNDHTDWPEGWVAYDDEHEWLLAEGPDGPRTVYAEYRNDAQMVLELSDDIEYNASLPAAVADLAAVRGHNEVTISWTHDGNDTAGYEIYRGMWYDGTPGVSAYPYYGTSSGDVIPTRPADHQTAVTSAEWELAGFVEAGVMIFIDSWPDATSRGIYYYEVFAQDSAENFSPPAETNDRATNYILGDINGSDGDVDEADVAILDIAYGHTIYPNRPNPETDVGPTDYQSGAGTPLPDSYIGFEDLMIYSQNYGYESGSDAQLRDGTVVLAWVRLDPYTYSLRLAQSGSGVKGLNVSGVLPDGTIPVITAGPLLDQQAGPVFLKNVDSHGLDVGLSVLGAGVDIAGSGELLTVTLPEEFDLDELVIVARDVNNSAMDYVIDVASDVPLATAFALSQNYPNPFNPMTTIDFTLPETYSVRLSVYSIDGRLVADLVNGQLGAGQHTVVWMGRDDRGQTVASGTYFYRIVAGPFSDTQKMALTK